MKNQIISVQLPQTLVETLKKNAECEYITLSAYIRKVLMKSVENKDVHI